jgi:hypothetical protein
MQKAADAVSEGLEVSWILRESLVLHGTSKFFMRDAKLNEQYQNVLTKLREVQ